MRRALTIIAILPILGLLMSNDGCVVNGPTEVVLNTNLCAWFEEHRTDGTLSGSVVCDQPYLDKINSFMDEHGLEPADIHEINVVAGNYKTANLQKQEEWTISASVCIYRQDDPQGAIDAGPADLMSFRSQSLREALGPPVDAGLLAPGVAIISDALLDAVNGGSPRLVIELKNGTISPAPTVQDPLDFKHKLCVRVQIVAWIDP